MSTRVNIPDDLAEQLELRRQAEGLSTLDQAAEKVIREGLEGDVDGLPYSVEELRAMIDEADASGPPEPWDGKAIREEVLRRHAARKAG